MGDEGEVDLTGSSDVKKDTAHKEGTLLPLNIVAVSDCLSRTTNHYPACGHCGPLCIASAERGDRNHGPTGTCMMSFGSMNIGLHCSGNKDLMWKQSLSVNPQNFR